MGAQELTFAKFCRQAVRRKMPCLPEKYIFEDMAVGAVTSEPFSAVIREEIRELLAGSLLP